VASPFDILRVDPDASDREIDRAYRRRVMETHPDQGGSAREFQRVKVAYERIKAGYDVDELDTRFAESADPSTDDDGDEDDEQAGRAASAGNGRDRDPHSNAKSSSDSSARSSSQSEGVRVEYLNYDVLADHGWSLDDDNLFEKAAEADLDPADRGRFLVQPRESLLQAAENCGYAWPYACRGGACANCAVAVTEGELEMPSDHILSPAMRADGIELSCIGVPTPDTEELKVVFNVKHLPDLEELRLPASRFENAQFND
jgi:ferredoxin